MALVLPFAVSTYLADGLAALPLALALRGVFGLSRRPLRLSMVIVYHGHDHMSLQKY